MNSALSLKLTVSITSVPPSQLPRESPSNLGKGLRTMRAAVERNDPGVVNHLDEDHHVALVVEQLKILVVRAHRRQRPSPASPPRAAATPGTRLPALQRTAAYMGILLPYSPRSA